MRERIRLAYNGVVAVHLDSTGEAPLVDLEARGLYTDEGRVLEQCRRDLQGFVADGGLEGDGPPPEERIARYVRGRLKRAVGSRPEVLVFITGAR